MHEIKKISCTSISNIRKKCTRDAPLACKTSAMFDNAFKNLDKRKWFDRMHPQTLAIAMWLCYLDGVFAFIGFVDKTGEFGVVRFIGGIQVIFGLIAICAYFVGPFLMANGKLLGWYVALTAAFSPLIIRFTAIKDGYNVYGSLMNRLTGGTLIGIMFEAALCALLLHTMTRSYVKTWLR